MAGTVLIGTSSTAEAAARCHFSTPRVGPVDADGYHKVSARLFRGSTPYVKRKVWDESFDHNGSGIWERFGGDPLITNGRGRARLFVKVMTPPATTMRFAFDGNARTLPCTSDSVTIQP